MRGYVYKSIFFLAVVYSVTESHKTVAHVDVFNHCVGVNLCYVIMAEIPEIADSQLVKLINDVFNAVFWNTEENRIGFVLTAVIINFVVISDYYTAQLCSDFFRVTVKYSCKLKSSYSLQLYLTVTLKK